MEETVVIEEHTTLVLGKLSNTSSCFKNGFVASCLALLPLFFVLSTMPEEMECGLPLVLAIWMITKVRVDNFCSCKPITASDGAGVY